MLRSQVRALPPRLKGREMDKEMKFMNAQNIWELTEFCNKYNITKDDIVVLFEKHSKEGNVIGYTLVYYGAKRV